MIAFACHKKIANILLLLPASFLSLLTALIILSASLLYLSLPCLFQAKVNYAATRKNASKLCFGWHYCSINISLYPRFELSIGQYNISYLTFKLSSPIYLVMRDVLSNASQFNPDKIRVWQAIKYFLKNVKYRSSQIKLFVADPILSYAGKMFEQQINRYIETYLHHNKLTIDHSTTACTHTDIKLCLACRPLKLYFGLKKILH